MWGGEPGPGGLLDPDGAHEQIARWRDRVDQMAGATQAMSDQLRDARVTTADVNGLVEVTVDATGRLVDLQLSERVRRSSPEVIAKTIMQTIALASGQMGQRAQQIIADTMGTQSPAAREIAERMMRHLQTPDQAAGNGAEWSRGGERR